MNSEFVPARNGVEGPNLAGFYPINANLGDMRIMGKRIVVQAGERFGRLSAVREVTGKSARHRYYEFMCDCGEEITRRLDSVTRGYCRSCGCYNSEVSKRNNTIHGYKGHPAYKVWMNMISRCSPRSPGAADYAYRGISVCSEWRDSPVSFCDWAMKNGFEAGLELDRRNNHDGYSPSNCRFATHSENNQNTRNSYWWWAGGKRYSTAREVEAAYGITSSSVVKRCNSKRFPDFWREKKYSEAA